MCRKYLKMVTEHSHLSDKAKVEAKRVLAFCRGQAASSQDPTSHILQDARMPEEYTKIKIFETEEDWLHYDSSGR